MAPPNAKKSGTAPRLSKPAPLPRDVEGVRDLGGGYVIVKIRPSSVRDAVKGQVGFYDPSVPAIPDDQVSALIERVKGLALPKARKNTRITSRKAETVPNENATFMNKLAGDAMADRQRQLQQGHLLSATQVSQALRVTRQAISKAAKEYRLFSIDGPSGTQLFPAFFTNPQFDRRDLEQVSVALGDLPGPSKWQFFTTPKLSLGGKTPVQALAAGKGALPRVLAAAAAFRER